MPALCICAIDCRCSGYAARPPCRNLRDRASPGPCSPGVGHVLCSPVHAASESVLSAGERRRKREDCNEQDGVLRVQHHECALAFGLHQLLFGRVQPTCQRRGLIRAFGCMPSGAYMPTSLSGVAESRQAVRRPGMQEGFRANCARFRATAAWFDETHGANNFMQRNAPARIWVQSGTVPAGDQPSAAGRFMLSRA